MSRKPNQNESSKVVDISELKQAVAEKVVDTNFELHQRIQQLEKMLEEKIQEVKHLQTLLDAQVPQFSPVLTISDAELIALKQIESLKKDSENRRLTLEEARMYEIFVKSLRSIQADTAKQPLDTIQLPKDKSKLLEIAAKKINDETQE